MKKILPMVLFALVQTQVAQADFISGGLVTRFHTSGDKFGVFLSGTTGCGDGWYYSYRSDYATPDDYKAVMAVALTAYAKERKISVFHGTPGCTAKRFVTIDTQD